MVKKPGSLWPKTKFLWIFCLFPVGAWAHPGHGEGFLAGLLHPLTGVDHLLAMVSVGWIAVRMGGAWRWALPSLFVAVLAAAAVLGVSGLRVSFTESMVASSLLAFAAMVARRPVDTSFATSAARSLSLGLTLGGVALFGFFHGLAHGAEIGGHSRLPFFAGFSIASVGLHGVGIFLGLVMTRAQLGRPADFAFAGLMTVVGSALLLG